MQLPAKDKRQLQKALTSQKWRRFFRLIDIKYKRQGKLDFTT